MNVPLKESIPPTAISAARLIKTKLTLAGWRDRERTNGFREALARMAAQPLPKATGAPVLFFSLRGWYPHVAWESVIAHALRLRGFPVHMFSCGGELPLCEVNFRGAHPAVACRECAVFPAEIGDSLALPQSWLRDYIGDSERRDIDRAVAAASDQALPSFSWNGAAVGRLVRDSVMWYLRKSTIEAPDMAAYRAYVIAGARIAVMAPRLLAAVQPRAILELNGRFFAERIFNTYVDPNIPTTTYECGWRKDTLGFDRLSPGDPIDLDEPWSRWKDIPLTPEESDELNRWIASRAGGDMQRDFYIRFAKADIDAVRQRLDLDPTKKTAVLFTNLVWDTAVLGRDEAFRSIGEWLLRTIEEFERRPDWQLIIRIHPAEDLRPSQPSVERLSDFVNNLPRLPANVRLLESLESMSSYALMEASDATLVYTSTAGLEAGLHRRPVVVAARVYYRGRGFSIDVPGAAQYPAALEQALSGPQQDGQLEMARRFAYLLLFRYLKSIPVVRQQPQDFPLWMPDEVDQLHPGGSSHEFDRLLHALTTAGPYT